MYAVARVASEQSKTDFNGHVTTYAYDTNNRLLSKTPDAAFSAQPITFTYFANGQRKTMADLRRAEPAEHGGGHLRHHQLHL